MVSNNMRQSAVSLAALALLQNVQTLAALFKNVPGVPLNLLARNRPHANFGARFHKFLLACD